MPARLFPPALTDAPPAVFVVDASIHPFTRTCGTGAAAFLGSRLHAFAWQHSRQSAVSFYAECLAIADALDIAWQMRLPAVSIGTDQAWFVRYFLKRGTPPLRHVLPEVTAVLSRIDSLRQHFAPGQLSFFYANTPEYRFLYKRAHALSRLHLEVEQKEAGAGGTASLSIQFDPAVHARRRVVIRPAAHAAHSPLHSCYALLSWMHAYVQRSGASAVFSVAPFPGFSLFADHLLSLPPLQKAKWRAKLSRILQQANIDSCHDFAALRRRLAM